MSQIKNQLLQIFIQSANPQWPNRALTLNPNQTLRDLKHSLLSPSLPPQSLSSLYFSLNGKTLDDSCAILSSVVKPFSTLTLRFKLLGGGGDGGATGAESRDCYLNMYAVKKPDKVDPNEQRLSKWTTCGLSFEPLKPPCVIDRLGNVFNKEALVKALLDKSLPREFGHIKGLRDMITVQLSVIPGLELDDHVRSGTRFHCPISGLEFNGKYKFIALKNCGHVLSAKALKEVKSSTCLVCHRNYDEVDKILINGNDEEVALLRARMDDEKAKLKDKKPKKVKNEVLEANGEEVLGADASRLSGTKHGIDVKETEKLSGKIEVNSKVANGGDVAKGASEAPAKRFKAIDIAPAHANKEVYASIFTSSRKSKFKETFTCRSLPLGRN
ncbi:hypothetical protein Nepgr_006305 [Nepenthes gracilis]|uniref:Ubiquitin-like domain-containing protein n=1 Tax=Nepenthes gracilis TaxID=150966 RepID=A0AAD3S4Y5_NEPGR|nr:hypothetical protein Nepgr_006305 [Nepenthes gracilis]